MGSWATERRGKGKKHKIRNVYRAFIKKMGSLVRWGVQGERELKISLGFNGLGYAWGRERNSSVSWNGIILKVKVWCGSLWKKQKKFSQLQLLVYIIDIHLSPYHLYFPKENPLHLKWNWEKVHFMVEIKYYRSNSWEIFK